MPPKKNHREEPVLTRRSTRLTSVVKATTKATPSVIPKPPATRKKTPARTASSTTKKKKAALHTKNHSDALPQAAAGEESPQNAAQSWSAAEDDHWKGIHYNADGTFTLQDSVETQWLKDAEAMERNRGRTQIEKSSGRRSLDDLDGMELSDGQETLAVVNNTPPPASQPVKKKRGRGRPPKPRDSPEPLSPPPNAKPQPKPSPPLPLPFESPMPPRAEFHCDRNGVSKTVRLDYHVRWEEARLRFLDAMNVPPFERIGVRLGCRNSDSRATESPLAIDEAPEWDDLMKTLRMHRNACARNSKLRPKEPVTILDITVPVADKTAPAKAGAKGKGHATSSAPEHSGTEVAAAQKKMKIEDALTTLRLLLRCDTHDRCCRIVPPRRSGEKAKHVPWTLNDLTTWAKYMVAGLTNAKTPPPEVLQRTKQEDALAEPIRGPLLSQSRRHRKHSELSDPLSESEDSGAEDQPARKAPHLGLESQPRSMNPSSKASENLGQASFQPVPLVNPQDYPLTASFLNDLKDEYAGDFEFKRFAHAIGRVHGLVRINHLVAAGGGSISARWLSELVDDLDLGTAQIIWDEARTRVQMIGANTASS